ncbi:HAMP domain-containing histidine kinase [Gramella sp. BOM4]|nr:HAMP domain-containing histidine kinase [Christiangramia bathymodioli]
MKLATFIRVNKKDIINDWTTHAKENLHLPDGMELEAVEDHIVQMLDRIVDDMDSSQTDDEQKEKSRGKKNVDLDQLESAFNHGEQRLTYGFDFMDLSSEFRALRASVLRLWSEKSRKENWEIDFHDMIRFNEAIDELWINSLKRFQEKLDESKNLFLGILGHDLRSPISTLKGANSVLSISENLSEKQQKIIKYSNFSIDRMVELIDNLLELTRLRLGGGISFNKKEMDLCKQAKKILRQFRLGYPEQKFDFTCHEEKLVGKWDRLRLSQLMTNLITNAIRHGEEESPISVKVSSDEQWVKFSVHNDGNPISEEVKSRIFSEGFTTNGKEDSKSKCYGLGLLIAKEVAEGHEGHIEFSSSWEKGTTFTVFLPR